MLAYPRGSGSPSRLPQRTGVVGNLRARINDAAAEYTGLASLARAGPAGTSLNFKPLSSSWGVGDKPPQRLLPSIESTLEERERSAKTQCAPNAYVTYVTVVFDLDETLVNNRRLGKAIIRPGAIETLKTLRSLSNEKVYVEIVLWTASMESVAKPVLLRLDPTGEIFDHCIFRDRRWYKESGYTKDLRRLGRDMRRTVIIENSPLSVELNRRNAILVKDFVGGPSSVNDNQLDVVKNILSEWIAAVNHAILAADSPTTDPVTPAFGDAVTPRMAAVTTLKTGEPEAKSPIQPFPHFGPTIVEFLAKHPQVSAGNELIVHYPKSAVTGVVSGTLRSGSVPRFGAVDTSFTRRSTSMMPQQRSLASIGWRNYGANR